MEIKTCRECEKPKSLTKFKKGKSGAHISICTACTSRRERQASPEYFNFLQAKIRATKPWRAICQDSRQSDKKKGRVGNDLDPGFVQDLIKNGCQYCGETRFRMTLDRKNNDLAHTRANVIPACIRCNYARGSLPFAVWEFILPQIKEAVLLGLFGEWKSESGCRKYDFTAPPPKRNSIRNSKIKLTREELELLVSVSSMAQVARDLGVSRVAIFKRLKKN